MYDLFMSRVEGFPQVRIQDIIKKHASGIDLAPSQISTLSVPNPTCTSSIPVRRYLKDALEQVKDTYDFILIDTPPSMGQFVINGLYAADHIIVTLDSGSFALNGITTLATIFSDMRRTLQRRSRSIWQSSPGGVKESTPECTGPAGDEQTFSSSSGVYFTEARANPGGRADKDPHREEERARRVDAVSGDHGPGSHRFTPCHSRRQYTRPRNAACLFSHFAPESSAGQAYRINYR